MEAQTAKVENLWKRETSVFPLEIIYIRSLFLSKNIMHIAHISYVLAIVFMAICFLFLIVRSARDSHTIGSHLYIIFFFGYAIFYISLPPLIYQFLTQIFVSNDFSHLFSLQPIVQPEGNENERTSNIQIQQYYRTFACQASIISKFNYLSSIIVSIAYCLGSPELGGEKYWVAIIFCLLFILPTTTMFILVCFLLQVFRLQEVNYLTEIAMVRDALYQYRYQNHQTPSSPSSPFSSSLLINPFTIQSPFPSSTVEMNIKSSLLQEEGGAGAGERAGENSFEHQLQSTPTRATIKQLLNSLLERYVQLHAYSHSISLKFGHVFLICLINSLGLIISSIWSLYRKENSITATLGYVFIGLIFFHEVAYLIVDINEKSFIISRELSNCILSIQFCKPPSSSSSPAVAAESLSSPLRSTLESPLVPLPIPQSSSSRSEFLDIHLTGEEMNQYNLFLNCMEHSKIQIFLFGNMTLRFRTLLGLITSILAAIIPGIVQ